MAIDSQQDSNASAQAAFDGVPMTTEAPSAPLPVVDATTTATTQAEATPKPVSAKPAVKTEWEIEREKMQAEHARALEVLQRNAAAANGKYGAAKQKLDKLLADQAALEAEASKKKSESRAKTWAEFSENYPEFAGPLEARHTELEEKIRLLESQLGGKAQQQDNVMEPPEDGMPDIESQVAQKVSAELFAKLHPDANKHAWSVTENGVSTQKYSPEFQQWLGTLPAAEQKDTVESWDAAFVSRQFTKFEQWNSARTNSAATSKAKSQQRVQGAVLPAASKAPVSSLLSAQEAFDQA